MCIRDRGILKWQICHLKVLKVKAFSLRMTGLFFQEFLLSLIHIFLPGFWTIGGYKPLDTAAYDWQVVPDKDYWI